MDPTPAGNIPNRQPLVLAFTITMTVLATVAVALRIIARRLSAADFWYDDYTCLFALIMSYLTDATEFAGLHYGFGYHAKDLNELSQSRYLLILYVLQFGYILTVTAVKFSFLLFYWRIFRTRSRAFRMSLLAVAAFTTAWILSTQITQIFQCTPVNYYWNRHLPGGYCINAVLFYLVTSAFLPVLDFAILGLAVPVVWSLKMSTVRQASILLIFSLGTLQVSLSLLTDTFRTNDLSVSVCCIVCLTVLHEIDPKDITWTNVIPGIWSNIEASIGVVCCCLPTMGPLIIRMKGGTSHASITACDNERNGTAPSTLGGEGFQRMDEPGFATSYSSRPLTADVHAFAHASSTPASDQYEMKGIKVTKTMDQKSASENHVNFQLENSMGPSTSSLGYV